MKKLFVFFVVSLFLIANTAFGGEADLEGCWNVHVDCIGDGDETGDFPLKIQNQSDGLFEAINCIDTDAAPCYGAIDGKNIYITCWDNIITGQVYKNGSEMDFITQNQRPDPKGAGTCKGTAVKEVDDTNCTPCPPSGT